MAIICMYVKLWKEGEKPPAHGNVDTIMEIRPTDLDFDLYVSQRKKTKTYVVTIELDHYLAEDVHPRTSDFDLLGWWKFNGAKYPILQDNARDLLVVPFTSVASAYAFNSGRRLLDPHWSRLDPTTVEAMMILRTWIQDDSKVSTSEFKALEGVFSAIAMDDSRVEENTDN